MANEPKSFAEWIRANGGTTPQASVPKVNLDALSSKKAGEVPGSKAPQNPLDWIMDIASRPLYGVTNITNQALNEIEKSGETRKKLDAGDPSGFLASLGNIATAGVRGVFSADEKDHAYTSEILEKGTDVFGKRNVKDYEDVENNVNPIFKGILGFAGDVALDPLSYIPGAAIAAGGKKLFSATRLGGKQAENALAKQQLKGEIVKGDAKYADDIETATDEVLKDATKVEKPTEAGLVDSKASKSDTPDITPEPDVPAFTKMYGPVPKADAFQPDELTKFSSLTSEARLSPRAGELSKGLDDLEKSKVFSVEVAKAGKAERTKPLPFGIKATGEFETEAWLPELAKSIGTFKKMSDVPKITVAGEKVSLAKLAAEASQGDARSLKVLESFYQKAYLPSFAKARQAGREIDALGRLLPPRAAKPTSKVVEEVVDSVTALRRQIADETSAVTAALGPKLTSALAAMANPEKLDATILRLRTILDGTSDVQHINRTYYTKPVKTLMDELLGEGVGDVIPVGIRQMRSAKNVTKPDVSPEALALVMEKMGGTGEDAPFIVGMANDALTEMVKRDFIEIKDPSKWGYETKKGVARTEKLYGDGYARRHRELNTYSQYTLTSAMTKRVSDYLKSVDQGAQGLQTASKKQRLTMEGLRLTEDTLDSVGIIPTIGVGDDRIPLAMSQILHTLSEGDGHGKMLYLFWNWGTAVPETALMDGVYQALKTGDPELVRAAVTATTTRYMTSDGRIRPMPNNLTDPKWGKRLGGQATKPIDDLPSTLVDLIMSKTPQLKAIAEANDTAWRSRVADETYDLSEKAMAWIQNSFENEAGFGPALNSIYNAGKKVADLGNDIGVTQKAAEATHAIVQHAIPDLDKINAAKAVEGAKIMENASKLPGATPGSIQTATIDFSQKAFDDAAAHSLENTKFIPGGDSRDLGQKIDQLLGGGILSKVAPLVSRRAGAPLLHETLTKSEVVFRGMVSKNARRIKPLAAAMDKPVFASVLKAVQHGVRHPDPAMSKMQDEVADLWAQMFGREGDTGLMLNPFFREMNNVDHINSVFAKHKMTHAFDLDDATTKAAENSTSMLDELVQQPSHWDIEDPAEFLNTAYTAFASVQVHQAMGQTFMKMAKDIGAVSKVPKRGYTSVRNEGGSILSAYLPHDVYFDDVVTRQFNVVDNIMQDAIRWDGPVKDFIDNYYRPLQDAWKYGMTLINPTHHIRNAVSDSTLQFYALGSKGFMKSFKSAGQALATRNGYSNWDAIKYLQGFEELPNAGHTVAKGKLGELTADGLHTAAANRGNLPTFKELENLEESGRGAVAQKWQDFTNTTAARKIGGISEARDHLSRMAHFAQFVDQNIDNTKKYRTLSELLDDASANTRRWHPDGTDMTAAESGIFRLVIPFYSWQRKAIPLILESVLTNPARVMAFPKASFNIAVANGINPDSLADPFPDDQMFPSYLTNQIQGPQFEIGGKYYGINPGIAANDILNDYVGGDVGRSVLGSVSPLIRAPFELAAGGQVGTGARINDQSDYIDSNTPIAGPLSRMTGTSASGSLLSILQGQGLDPQYQTARGNKKGDEAIPLINWLTGAGITPMSQPNQINYAEIEKRNREKGETSGF